MKRFISYYTHKYLTIFGGLMSALILVSPGERVKLLRAGITGNQIEILFVKLNNYKLIKNPILFNPPRN